MPIVDINFRLKVPSVYCCRKLDLPTPESPGKHENTVAQTQYIILQSGNKATKSNQCLLYLLVTTSGNSTGLFDTTTALSIHSRH